MLNTQILNRNKDFLILYKKGRSVVGKYAVIYFRKNKKNYNRLGITAGKKVGNAVCRNRAKRVIRQAYRENEKNFPAGIDFVIVARAAVCDIKSNVLSQWIEDVAVRKIRSELNGGNEK